MEFTWFLNKHCGTQRSDKGGLNEEAGRITHFDELAAEFFAATGAARQTIYEKAKTLVDEANTTSKHYLRVMDKLVNGAEEYLQKEKGRLANILQKKSLAPEKLDEIKIKANILAQFVEKKVEEAEEAVKEAAGKAKDEAEKLAHHVKEEL